jgi:hypothetical protein
MLILIEKDAATRVPKEVADLNEARGYVAQGFTVHLMGDDGTVSPLPGDEPAATEAVEAAPAAKKPKAAKKG